MKKLRMIVTSVIVLAIVGSAFAFKAKLATFCISTDNNNSCDRVDNNRFIDPTNGTDTKYFNGWTGSSSTCVGTSNCTSTVPLSNN